MKYVSDRNPTKYFLVSKGWGGGWQIKEYRNDQFATKLVITDQEYPTWMERLQKGGWTVAE